MPCEGCKKRDEINMGVKGKFWMKFIGKPDGVFMKGAPGNFVHGEKYYVPYGHSKFPFWEMLEEEPVLVVPEETDSFEEAYFVPDADEWSYEDPEPEPVVEETVSEPEVEEVTVSDTAPVVEMTSHTPIIVDGVDYSPNAPAVLEPYGTFSPATGKVGEHNEELVAKNRGEKMLDLDTKLDNMSRGVLLDILKEAGVEVKPRTRTTTLRKMVDELEEK